MLTHTKIKKFSILLIGILPFIIAALGITQNLTLNDIQDVSTNFILQYRSANTTALRKSTLQIIRSIEEIKDTRDRTIAYVSHLDPKGFLILSSRFDLNPVIAYSYLTHWNPDTSKINPLYHLIIEDLRLRTSALPLISESIKVQARKEWQKLLSWDISSVTQHNFVQWPPEGTTSTGGWLETTWHQLAPYNKFCPLDRNTEDRCYVGCVATALAQIVNYHTYIGSLEFNQGDAYQSTGGIHIDDDSGELNFPEFEALNTYLDQLRNNYSSNLNVNEDEIAALNFACGKI